MKTRCLSQTSPSYADYGGRGITICQEWIDSFECFYRDMGPRPTGTSLDRTDVNGPYCKSNCTWATVLEQARNKRNTITATYQGITLTVQEWCDRYQATRNTVMLRLEKGWPLELALFAPGKTKRAVWEQIASVPFDFPPAINKETA
jgi:hypothetical protein